MHDAYEAVPLLQKLPLQIESITCYDDALLVGTKPGHLLYYTVKPVGRGDTKVDVSLERSHKSFSKRPVLQLEAIPELDILVSLSDNVISVHDLKTITLITTLHKTKGATLFATDVQTDTDGVTSLRLCVAVKRKLQLFAWRNKEFIEMKTDLSVPDLPRSMAWCKDSLCIGFKREYFLIKVGDGTSKDLFPTGRQLEPLVTKLSNNQLVLGRDHSSIFINHEGNPTKKHALIWSDIPVCIEHQPPYLIAVLPKYIEVRTIEPRTLIQSLELPKPQIMCQGSGHVYVASTNHVWRLLPIPITTQIRQLLQSKEFELALLLAKITDEPESEKEARLHTIQNLYAFELFQQYRFEESLQLFAKLGTDPAQVIGLYSGLLPTEFRDKLIYPDKPPELEGVELEKGLLALLEYLTQKRNDLLKDMSTEVVSSAIVAGSMTIKSKNQLHMIIDTTLLKCYLQTNDALVASLLRLKDNQCHVEESVHVLKKNQKHNELIILFEKKGLHKRALDLLLRLSQMQSSPMKGTERTVIYLQHLGSEHLDLIFQFASWVLKANPEDGMRIFTEDLPEVEGLPRDRVVSYLDRISKEIDQENVTDHSKASKELVLMYLDHIICTWQDETPAFHNRLINLYREKAQSLMPEYPQTMPEGLEPVKAGTEPGELGEVRRKLISFLKMSRFYQPERLLTYFPFDGFFEERALLLGRLGRHEDALAIYIHTLHDYEMAEEHCKVSYERDGESSRDVYLSLLKMYLQPPNPATAKGSLSHQDSKPNIGAALKILKEQATKMDTSKVLAILPTCIGISDVLSFLETVLEDREKTKRNAQILKSLRYSENLTVQEQRMFYQRTKFMINSEKMCRVCRKRIGTSAFARYPNGVIVHYVCCKDPDKCPVEP